MHQRRYKEKNSFFLFRYTSI